MKAKRESHYQKHLISHYNGTRLRLDCGITDITTSEMHIEIKHWKNWKHAIGQLQTYNQRAWRSKLYCAFFGDTQEINKKAAIEICNEYGIGILELTDIDDEEVDITTLLEAKDYMVIG